MMKRFSWAAVGMSLLLAACAGHPPQQPPVVEHGLTGPLEVPPYHVVAAGDTLWSVALRYDRDYRELARINHLSDDYRIRVGQRLILDPALEPKAPAVKPRPHLHPKVAKTTPPPLPQPAPAPAGLPAVTPAGAEGSPGVSPVSLAPVAAEASSPVTVVAPPSPQAGAAAPVKGTPPVGNSSKTVPAASSAEGLFTWGWPARGPILSRFSDGALGNKGLDIGGRRGDAVLAAGDGSVVYVGTGLVGYGKLIIIRHNNNYLSAYAHNDRFLVKEGQHVKLGQEIAEMGSSGADRDGLHFEIRRQGKPVDPLQYLPSR